MLDMNEWLPIPDHPHYEVNRAGDIRLINEQRRLKATLSRRLINGYPCVTCGYASSVKVHKAVTSAFLGPANGRCVRHLDGDPTNCHLSNLVYGTLSENQRDRVQHGTAGKLTPRHIKIIRKLYELDFSQKRLSEIFGVVQPHISRIIRNECWSTISTNA